MNKELEFINSFPKSVPAQTQNKHPGIENIMNPRPIFDNPNYKASNKFENKVVLITGGDSGIGRAVSIAFAKEGANIAIIYFDEHDDAKETKNIIESTGRKCLLIPGDITDENFCIHAVEQVINEFYQIDILINNAAVQYPQNSIEDISKNQLEKTFATNIFSMFYLTKATLPYLKQGSSIINTTSITAYKGNEVLIDYSSTKGAIVSFTRSLSLSLSNKGIRVNAVAPGPIWTPFIPSSFDQQRVMKFGCDTTMKRLGQPVELIGAYIYLASQEASYVSGQVIHVNGGEVVNG
ncbi:SDR family oxidoreductase [Clostridium botulinum C]|uniref:SDR family oxidoreductase n=5 Tax=Clostridium TaxID=1485 RepID=A0A9Q4TNA4_CLOBO|nr:MULTISPECIES: SDR family oxidoreductase [Clostridium]EGO87565.1 short-chain dehydrogenase [Clostridium botulinum C str. Stockholm]AYF54652.1 NAD(P)-dependent oxidoreductase [Clostridium novyi]EES90813.1 oxidoreductase, short chain dehydrogenase/reductase family [Clostridium botulinum D str. 1873]KEI10241.1 short-chain dehydrogenase [Clostridium sp. K25]KEI13917.1 short-chain dehydrogenase [Clostridium novyi B str. NCTC 9691]